MTGNQLVADLNGRGEPVGDVLKALADHSRRRLLDQLHHRDGQTLRELCADLTTSRQAVSKHLAVLEAAGLVVPVRRGGRSRTT